jgi:hypothetical protein
LFLSYFPHSIEACGPKAKSPHAKPAQRKMLVINQRIPLARNSGYFALLERFSYAGKSMVYLAQKTVS